MIVSVRSSVVALFAVGSLFCCSSSDDGGSSTSSSSSSTSSASSSGASGSSSGASSSSGTASSSSSGTPASAAGSIEVTLAGKPIVFLGTTTAIVSNNSTLLTFVRKTVADGAFDPQNPVPVTTIELVFEDTLKPFVLPTVGQGQNRRAVLDVNGVQYHSSITTAKPKSDTFVYENGHVKGVWTFEAPRGAANQPLEEIILTADVEIPTEVR